MFQDPFLLIIGLSLLVILSYFYNLLSAKTGIPSVIMLIATGIGAMFLLGPKLGESGALHQALEVLGLIGLLVIVLEGTMDIRITRDKRGMILKAFLVAAIILVVTTFSIAGLIHYFLGSDFYHSMVYAVPLAIVSSAIVIPSLDRFLPVEREFLIYESAFSDILGIMFFDFLIFEDTAGMGLGAAISSNLLISVVSSVVFSILMILVFKRIKTKVRLFLFLAVLAFLFAGGKYFHLSALLIVLVFGISLQNPKILFFGKLRKYLNEEAVQGFTKDFKSFNHEAAFLVRTLFFVVFGMTMNLEALGDKSVWIIGASILVAIYLIRFMCYAWRR